MISPSFEYEKKLWKKKLKFVVGADEVGRGCFAGPVVAAAVAFAPFSNFHFPISNGDENIIINDSKKLTNLQRSRAEKWIKENAVSWGVGGASAKVINRLGIAIATKMAFRKAVGNAGRIMQNKIDYLLTDAFFIPYLRGFPRSRQLAIVRGDEKSISIAAASIIAKVYRDNLMEKIGSRKNYKKYEWQNNKGYGTRVHRDAILKFGITGYHRKAFVETFLKSQ